MRPNNNLLTASSAVGFAVLLLTGGIVGLRVLAIVNAVAGDQELLAPLCELGLAAIAFLGGVLCVSQVIARRPLLVPADRYMVRVIGEGRLMGMAGCVGAFTALIVYRTVTGAMHAFERGGTASLMTACLDSSMLLTLSVVWCTLSMMLFARWWQQSQAVGVPLTGQEAAAGT